MTSNMLTCYSSNKNKVKWVGKILDKVECAKNVCQNEGTPYYERIAEYQAIVNFSFRDIHDYSNPLPYL